MYNETITLIKEEKAVDAFGDLVITTTETEVFAEAKSIGTKEFYQAQATGLRPEIKFVIADYLDYNGEQSLKYTPFGDVERVYSIIRTYRNGTSLELTATRGVDA